MPARPPLALVPQHFGCLVFDRRTSRYLPFDHEATALLLAAHDAGIAAALARITDPDERDAVLAFFDCFDRWEIDELTQDAAVFELERGGGLFSAGGPAEAAFLVIRGAVEIVAPQGASERRVTIAGPGEIVGYILNPDTHYVNFQNTCVTGNENAVWLENERVP